MAAMQRQNAAIQEQLDRVQEQLTPYSFGQAAPVLQTFVFEPAHNEFYPSGITSARGFFNHSEEISTSTAIASITNDIGERIRTLPRTPTSSTQPLMFSTITLRTPTRKSWTIPSEQSNAY
ncbi:hypothetical protein BGX33_001670 [Mortierella sp. NVP41]|nr:hypothetical protein BGX33_001670 [Mortierella sp. NVP41]